ncbi:putative deacylase [Azospirillum fermentarium]|uniref:succinylglutamate desuccinylase/aspartoacylase domain-containing protein n=1 Tax=Azospirillum fermentarium TaxID=1233114 RepID=UPI0022262E2E|nr:succinylglutamate desuccinylase/aspartoacylase family protein [Azospirillum fermentarium]MCW2245706.1 putative deacylase [Azospirillum fermentarium]
MFPIVSPVIPVTPTDIAPYRRGNSGIDYVTALDSGRPGPHALINAILHGNEIAGAAAIGRLLRLGLRPARGRLTLVLANTAAYHRFDPAHPYASRFLDEDMNRLWTGSVLDGPRTSQELRRARQLRPFYESADALLDLHSMGGESPPMILCGMQPRGRELARRMGAPGWVVADAGHAAGRRLIEHGPFADPGGTAAAVLVECGQHWRPETAAMAETACLRFLLALDMLDRDRLPEPLAAGLAASPAPPQRFVTVTHTVTAATGRFAFTQPLAGMEVVPVRGTVIAYDGAEPVATPYDACVMIMPARRVHVGQTAVRLGYLEG